MEIEQPLSDVERYKNYTDLVEAIAYIENNGRITEDWTVENKSLIKKWREWIPDFSEINEEREDAEFRKICSDTETIMRYLYGTITRSSFLDVKLYHMLLKHMKKILDMLADDDEMNDLLSMMKM